MRRVVAALLLPCLLAAATARADESASGVPETVPQIQGRPYETADGMIAVPAGRFVMGSPQSEDGRYDDEGPQHVVAIPAFAIAKYDVTFAQWDACVAGGGCRGYLPDDGHWGRGNTPVINVSWNDAQAYISWLSSQTGLQYRLPTEAEWEYATRAGRTTPFYWGTGIGSEHANCVGCQLVTDINRPTPGGMFPPNPWGIFDMAGNVWQWTEDCYHRNYVDAPTDGSAWLAGACRSRVLRGGSWSTTPNNLRSANRYRAGIDARTDHAGFRLARSLP